MVTAKELFQRGHCDDPSSSDLFGGEYLCGNVLLNRTDGNADHSCSFLDINGKFFGLREHARTLEQEKAHCRGTIERNLVVQCPGFLGGFGHPSFLLFR